MGNQEKAPYPEDAPDGYIWQCPDCKRRASLGNNAGYHRDLRGHGEPELIADPECQEPILNQLDSGVLTDQNLFRCDYVETFEAPFTEDGHILLYDNDGFFVKGTVSAGTLAQAIFDVGTLADTRHDLEEASERLGQKVVVRKVHLTMHLGTAEPVC